MTLTRREVLAAQAFSLAALTRAAIAAPPAIDEHVVSRNDASVEHLLSAQITDQSSLHRGGVPDIFNLHSAGSAGSLLEAMMASFICPQSRFYADPSLIERIRLAACFSGTLPKRGRIHRSALNQFRFPTRYVPLAVEINSRDGGKLEGCRPAPRYPDAWVLEEGYGVYRTERHQIRFGPGTAPPCNTQIRGAEQYLTGQSVHITGYTPFDHTLTFTCLAGNSNA